MRRGHQPRGIVPSGATDPGQAEQLALATAPEGWPGPVRHAAIRARPWEFEPQGRTEFARGMFTVNDRVLQLKGYAQRTTKWPAVGPGPALAAPRERSVSSY